MTMTTATKQLKYCKVVDIGSFAGGSFGTQGNPSMPHQMFRVHCPELAELEAAAHPAMADYRDWTFTTEWEAHLRAVQQEYREERRVADREAARRRDEQLAKIGHQIREAMRCSGIDANVAIRWTDKVATLSQMSPESQVRVRGMASGSHTDYDAKTEDGRLYRVRLGYCLSGGPQVVPIEAAR